MLPKKNEILRLAMIYEFFLVAGQDCYVFNRSSRIRSLGGRYGRGNLECRNGGVFAEAGNSDM